MTPATLEPRPPAGPYPPPRPKLREANIADPRLLLTHATLLLNRVLDRTPGARRLARGALAKMHFTEFDAPLAGLGAELDGARVVFLSDLHVGSYMGARELGLVMSRVRDLAPDAICFGGDLVNSREQEFDLLSRAIRGLSAPLGVYAVPGNHEVLHGLGDAIWRGFLDEHRFVDLTNRGIAIEAGSSQLWLAGVDDFEEGVPDLGAALDGRDERRPVLLLSHHPDFFLHAHAAGVDWTLSGHTHGGQIKFFGKPLVTHSLEGFAEGHFQRSCSALYVSRGVGMTFLPVRLYCPPEIVVLTLRHVDRSDP